MKAYLAQISTSLKLTFRDRGVIFFNYAFPLVFFFMFASLYKAERGGAIAQVLTMVFTIGVLGSGFFGAGIRAVAEREANILRRFKVAPISAGPILVASLVGGLINYLPSAVLMVILAHTIYGMEIPRNWLSLFVFLAIGVIAFRSLGLILASVVNSMQESQILIQLLYLPMLLLSGATIPLTILPIWVQIVAHFLPATYLSTGLQSILGEKESLFQNGFAVLALIITTILAVFISLKLFRWEKEEKLKASSKLWVLAVLTPFLILGTYQAYSRESVTKTAILEREQRRNRTVLIRNARIFTGNGQVVESGGVLIKNGKIDQIYNGNTPEPAAVKADVLEASGNTLLPGLIDVHVHLGAPGGFYASMSDIKPDKMMPRELAAYLYSGVTTVKSAGDPLDQLLKLRASIHSGERLGAELLLCGPMFTTEGGHGTEYFKSLPQQARKALERQMLRMPKTPEEARAQVAQLKKDGVDGIKAILEAGRAGMLFNRMDLEILRAVAAEARHQNLPIVIHTGDARDVADALSVGTNGIEHGSMRDRIPDEFFAQMKAHGVTYDPTLAVIEALQSLNAGSTEPIDRPLVQQVGPPELIQSTKRLLPSERGKSGGFNIDVAKQNLLAAYRAGVMLVTGTDSGNPLLIHGPAVHRELQLWVEAGIPIPVALQAATWNAARLLRIDGRTGLIQKGYEANLLLVIGNPLKDIKQTESINRVIFKGERIDRAALFE
ncbi:MAG: amidohydrolase family protein [Bryobacteraceae bacterium]